MPQLNQQLKTYLEAVQKNRCGPELYTPTQLLPLTAKASRRTKSDFDKSSQGDESTEQSEFKAQQVDVLEGLWHYAVEKPKEKTDKPVSSHVLLIGKPGSGKSTALLQLFREAVQKALAAKRYENPRIPVLIELRGILHPRQKEDVWIWIQDAIEAETRLKLPIEALKQWQNWLLLFDGLNEAAFETLQSLHSFLQRSIVLAIPTICTTRQLGADNDLGIRTRLEMLPLNEPQMREFVQKYLPEYGDVLLGQLQGRLQEIAETPLLLKMLCDVFKETQQIPQNRSELFQQFDRQYNSLKGSSLVDSDLRRHKSELLQYLAFKMLEGDPGNPTDYRLRVERSTAERWLEEFLTGRVEAPGGKAKKWLEGLQAHYLLQEADSNRYEVEFHHQLFQEYYAAEWLLKTWPDWTDDQRKCCFLNLTKWTESITLMAGLMDSEVKVEKLIRLTLEVDLFLAAKLTGALQKKFQNNATQQVLQKELPFWVRLQLMKEMGSELAIKSLCEFAHRDDWDAHEAIEALGTIAEKIKLSQSSRKIATDTLLNIIQDEDKKSWLRSMAIRTLGKTQSTSAIPILMLLFEQNEFWRDACEALGDLRYQPAVPQLIKLIENADKGRKYIFEYVPHALGKIKDKSSIPQLIEIMTSSPNKEARRCATSALRNIGIEDVSHHLCKLLSQFDSRSDEDFNCAVEIAWSFSKLGHLNLLDELINFFFIEPSLNSQKRYESWPIILRQLRDFGNSIVPRLTAILDGDYDSWSKQKVANAIERGVFSGWGSSISADLEHAEIGSQSAD